MGCKGQETGHFNEACGTAADFRAASFTELRRLPAYEHAVVKLLTQNRRFQRPLLVEEA